jgi:ATP/maltotriose-dependent transcriptional regulator MalT/DNA-binding SARP family transcriptional activator
VTAARTRSRPIIVTKVRPPRRRRDLLTRPRLADYIATHIEHKLLLVSAPPGYGKTSLLVDFVALTDIPTCWYRLDAGDADVTVFLEHLIASLRRHFPDAGERTLQALQTEGAPNVEHLVGSLVNEIDEQITQLFLLVLDDYHTVNGSVPVNTAVNVLLEYLPDNCRLILASRTVPKSVNLTRLAGQGQVAGLGQEHLRFTPEEIGQLVAQLHGETLSAEERDRLAEESEGWIAALVLGSRQLLDGVRTGLSRPVADRGQLFNYLADEVFAAQPAELQEFLLGSSILEEVAPELCDAVLDRQDSAAMLQQIEARNLFLTPVEGESQWYRFHQLFHDFLSARLAEAGRDDVDALHRRAATWYAEAGMAAPEIHHWLAAQDFEHGARRIEDEVLEAVTHGYWHTIIGWVEALPQEVRRRHPTLLRHLGTAYSNIGNLTGALELYRQAAEQFNAAGNTLGLAATYVSRATVWRFLGQVDKSIQDSQRTLELVGSTSGLVVGQAHRNLGICYTMRGDITAANAEFLEALRCFEEQGSSGNAALVHADLSAVSQISGDIERSLYHSMAARRYWEEVGNLGALALALNNMATGYYAQGRYAEALEGLTEALAKARRAGVPRIEALALMGIGDVEADGDDLEAALAHYEAGLVISRSINEIQLTCYGLVASAEAWRLSGALAEARGALAEAQAELAEFGMAFETALSVYVAGALALDREDFPLALRQLDDAAEAFARLGAKREQARALLYGCAAAQRSGDAAAAEAWWQKAQAVMAAFGYPEAFAPYARRLPEVFRRGWIHEIREDRSPAPVVAGPMPPVDIRPADEAAAVAMPAANRLTVRAFGVPEVWRGDELLEHKDWQTLAARDLFLFLADRPGGATVEQLMAAFWPDSPTAQARSSLHTTIYRIRRALGKDVIGKDVERYFVAASTGLHYDVAEFERLLRRAAVLPEGAGVVTVLEEAIALVRGEYVETVNDDWCHERREELALRITEAMLDLANARLRASQVEGAIADFRRVLDRDRLLEDAHRGLMRAYATSGDRVRALRQYEQLTDLLESELRAQPGPDTIALYEAIRGTEGLPAA